MGIRDSERLRIQLLLLEKIFAKIFEGSLLLPAQTR